MRRTRQGNPCSKKSVLVRLTYLCLVAALLGGAWVARDSLPFRSLSPEPTPPTTPTPPPQGEYANPLTIAPTERGAFESCPDPAIIRGQRPGDTSWYMYCTTNPLNGNDRGETGRLNYHLIPMLQSTDLVHWTYVGDAFSTRPSWTAGFALLWAPEIQFFNDRYYLYYTTTGTRLAVRGSAIGVATSMNPTGPWTDSGEAVVEPQASSANRRAGRSVYDAAVVLGNDGQRYLFYGSFVGGISARHLSADGLHTDPASEVQITIANRYEGVSVIKHDGYFYLFASAAECCNGPLSSYSVFVGRSRNLLGPYLDRGGVSMLAGQVGGTPVLSANGNRWVGPGHNTTFTDRAGQDWFLYHAVNRDDPYFDGTTMTKRPPLLDAIDWIDGWPSINGGIGPSDTPQPAPAIQPGGSHRTAIAAPPDLALGPTDNDLSDEFNPTPSATGAPPSTQPGQMWQWVRPPPDWSFGLVDGTLQIATQPGDLEDRTAAVLTEPTPRGDYVVETRVRLDLPPEGCCFNSVQAGLVIYGDDTSYLKLVSESHEQTRQTVFVNRVPSVSSRYPHIGSAVVGPPTIWAYLRIVKHTRLNDETYTAFTSQDGSTWVRGTTWTHALGGTTRIGLVAMGGAGFTASFDYVRVSLLPLAP